MLQFQAENLKDSMFGNYRVVRKIGEGAFSKVYLAVQSTLNDRPVALKVFKPELSWNFSIEPLIDQEIARLVQLDHANIVRIYEQGVSNGLYWYSMEYVEGGKTLKDLMQETKMSFEDIEDIVKQIMGALVVIHEKGIVHMDLNPNNVCVTMGGVAKLFDFGISIDLFQTRNRNGIIGGTEGYYAPEVREKDGASITNKADIYSLGAVYHELITGSIPIYGSEDLDRKQIPPIKRDLIKSMLNIDPNQRPDARKVFDAMQKENCPVCMGGKKCFIFATWIRKLVFIIIGCLVLYSIIGIIRAFNDDILTLKRLSRLFQEPGISEIKTELILLSSILAIPLANLRRKCPYCSY